MARFREINAALMEAKLAEENLRKANEERLVELERVRKRIATDNGLVALNRHTRQARQKLAGTVELFGTNVSVDPQCVTTKSDSHDDFFERGVAGPLPDAIDRALHLECAAAYSRERVGHGQT